MFHLKEVLPATGAVAGAVAGFTAGVTTSTINAIAQTYTCSCKGAEIGYHTGQKITDGITVVYNNVSESSIVQQIISSVDDDIGDEYVVVGVGGKSSVVLNV